MTEASWRLGIDVGGTFNDLVLFNAETGQVLHYKEPSVPADPSLAVERGISGLLHQVGLHASAIAVVVHGTTIGLNTILQRRGARLALVVSRGNRDVLELGRSRMPTAFDFTAAREEPLIPRDRVFEIAARVGADGAIVARPDVVAYNQLAQDIRTAAVDAVAVMLVNSYRHPALEAEVAAALRERLPDHPITASAAIWPDIREYERATVAALNAYIQPMMTDYFAKLEGRLRGLGLVAPLFITTSNGGTVSLATACERPIDTILSGPAAGVTASIRSAPAALRARLITFDMGGTSTDMSIVTDGKADVTHRARVGDFPITLPVVSVTAVGAGGGSVVWVDAQGVLKIGPESVAADPGPACYGRGGTRVAITDCYLAAGLLDADNFLGGRMRLDSAAAHAALTALAHDLGLTGADAALRVATIALRVATAKMGVEVSKLCAKDGLDIRDYTLMAFGGAGATHACLLAQEARIGRVAIAMAPGTFCALGASVADLRRDYARSLGAVLQPDGSGFAPVAAAIAAMRTEAAAWIAREGASATPPHWSLQAEMRFPGQAYELSIGPLGDVGDLNGAHLLDLFHTDHERRYGFSDRNANVRVGTMRVSVSATAIVADPPRLEPATSPTPIPIGQRRVFHDDVWWTADVVRRSDLRPGAALTGPVFIQQPDTTVWLIPGWHGTVDASGTLLLRPHHE